MIGNEEDFTASLGFEVEGVDEHLSAPRPRRTSSKMIEPAVKRVPELQRRRHHAAQREHRDRQRLGRHRSGTTASSTRRAGREDLEILDRVGGGDSFASGLIYGFLAGKGPQWAVEYGAAHGALAMTTPGDTSHGHPRPRWCA